MIDPNKPIQFVGDPDRLCQIVGVLTMRDADNTTYLLVTSIYGHSGPEWEEPMKFTLDGEPCLSRGSIVGASLRIENVPDLVERFFCIPRIGDRHMTHSYRVKQDLTSTEGWIAGQIRVVFDNNTGKVIECELC